MPVDPVRSAPGHRVARWALPLLLLAGSTGVSVPAAGAAPVSATATAVEPGPGTDCGDNPSALLDGSGAGDGFGSDGWGTEAGDPTPAVALDLSPLYDDWSYDGVDFGFPFPAAAAPGTVRGLYAVVGGTDLDPATTAEWFLLYECGSTAAESVVLLRCAGPFGTCPRSVDEALEPEPEPTVPTTATPPPTAPPTSPPRPDPTPPAAAPAVAVAARPGYTG